MMEKLKQFWNYTANRFLDPVYMLPFVQISPEVARLMDTVLYYLFLMALGVIAIAYWGIMEFSKGFSKLYKILLVCIIGVSALMCVWGFFYASVKIIERILFMKTFTSDINLFIRHTEMYLPKACTKRQEIISKLNSIAYLLSDKHRRGRIKFPAEVCRYK